MNENKRGLNSTFPKVDSIAFSIDVTRRKHIRDYNIQIFLTRPSAVPEFSYMVCALI